MVAFPVSGLLAHPEPCRAPLGISAGVLYDLLERLRPRCAAGVGDACHLAFYMLCVFSKRAWVICVTCCPTLSVSLAQDTSPRYILGIVDVGLALIPLTFVCLP